MSYARRIDDNQSQIVDALRAIGCSVQSLAALGGGCPDLLVGRNGINWLMEVKDGDKSPSQRKLTKDEAVWHICWKGQKAIVINVDEAFAVVGAKRM